MAKTKTKNEKPGVEGEQIGLRFQPASPVLQWLRQVASERGVADERGALPMIIREKLQAQMRSEQATA